LTADSSSGVGVGWAGGLPALRRVREVDAVVVRLIGVGGDGPLRQLWLGVVGQFGEVA